MRAVCCRWFLLLINSILFVIICPNIQCEAEEFSVPVKAYEFDDESDYSCQIAKSVDTMSFGKNSLGSFAIVGNINEETNYNKHKAYGVEDGTISFSYVFNSSIIGEERKFVDDDCSVVENISLSSPINNGALLILKSYDGNHWDIATNPVMNFIQDNPNGRLGFYTTSGEDINKGCYYKVLLAYMTKEKTGDTEWFFWDEIVSIRHLEEYSFYLAKNTADISIHNLSTKMEDIESIEGYSLEAKMAGESLFDMSATVDGFQIDKLGTNYTVEVNGVEAADKSIFTKDGRYNIVTTTSLGKTKKVTVFVFGGGSDKGFSTYFGETPFDGERIFCEEQYPTFSQNTHFRINKTTGSVPFLTGYIENLDTKKKIVVEDKIRTEHNYSLEPGLYRAEFFAGNKDCGSGYNYTFMFYIIDASSYPRANYNIIMNTDRLCDLSTKYYQVVYQTTGGGYITVCFTDYDKAFSYAYDIEKRFVEWSEGKLYYRAEDNSNQKIEYPFETDLDKIKLTRIINEYARKNVEIGYINTNEKYTYQTLADTEESLLDVLERVSTRESMKVFSDAGEKEKAVDKVPYINGHTFVHVGDYDVKTVQAICEEDDETYDIAFGKLIDNQLHKTGQYTIVETNEYDKITQYKVVYMQNNETEIVVDYNDEQITINSGNNGDTISAASLTVVKASNQFDKQAIVKISAPQLYDYDIVCKVDELKNLKLNKKGVYILTFIDRVGHIFEITADITDSVSDEDCYKEFYNNIYIGDK